TTSNDPGVDGAVTVTGGATHLIISGPNSTTAGHPLVLTVVAEDAFNNVASNYSGTIHFTSSDPQVAAGGALPSDATLSGGTGFFAAILETAGNQTITVTDKGISTLTANTAAIAVSPNTAAHFALSFSLPSYSGVPGAYSLPTPTASFASTGTPVVFTVTAQDLYGNMVQNYAGTVHFTANDTAATHPANSTLSAGLGVFSITLATAGSRFLTAADSINGSISGS